MKNCISSKRKLMTCISIGFLSISTLFSQDSKGVKTSRIINGSDAFIKDHPYQIDLGGCGGSVLGENWVITAAHCLSGNMRVRAGFTKKSEMNDAQIIRVKRTIKDPNSRSDIALLELESPLDLSGDLVKPIRYASSIVFEQGLVAKDKLCTATGWGLTDRNDNGSAADHLQIAELKFAQVALSDNRIRVDEYEDRMVCRGDSGGPLVVESLDESELILVGTVSGGTGTPCSDFGYWGNVAKAADWIQSVTGIEPYDGTILSTDDPIANNTFGIWPVPANDKLNINSKEKINALTIYSLLGEKLINTKETNQINVSALPNGTYIISDEENSISNLFVVQH